MLPLIPILMLAYGVLYAFALAIPKGFIEMDVKDAIAAPRALPLKIGIPISTPDTVTRRSTSGLNVERNIDPSVLAIDVQTESTGENVGFYHSCQAASPSCSFD